MSDDVHEVYAVRYAEHARMRSENYIFGDPHDTMTAIAYYVWVIKGSHGIFVCDTGFDEKAAKEHGRKIIHPVGEGLQALGIVPDQVDHATHMHWDHAGNYDLFPNARYHVQDTEMAYCTGRCMRHPMLRIPFSEDDVHAMLHKVYAFRVEFHDGVEELAPGITVHMIGGHSKGLQCVRVKTKRGYVVVASDCCHLYSHMDEGRVFPITYSVGDTLEGYKTLQKLPRGPWARPGGAEDLPGRDAEPGELDLSAGRGAEGLDQSQFREGIAVMLRALRREATEHHAPMPARAGGDLGRDGADRDARGEIGWKAIDARGDRRVGDRCQRVLRCKVERRAITVGQQRLLAVAAAAPDRADRVDDVARL
jgi:glyoxylase-like metal-dependent hydrolase (beta-lactamase superfamily II)